MKLFSFAVLFTFIISCTSMLQADHWFEAEDFKGNSSVVQLDSASREAAVEGQTWYRMVAGVPFPQDGDSWNVWARIQSDLPANWYLRETSGEKRIFGWFSTEKAAEWTWVKLGTFSSRIGKNFHDIYIQRPKNQSIPTVTGRIDVLVISKSGNAATFEKMLSDRLAGVNAGPVPSFSKEEIATLVSARRMADLPETKTPPRIDGILDDAAWKNAAKITDFTLSDGRNMATEQTIGYLTWDNNNLYIAAEMLESQIPFIRKVHTVRNDSVWMDDCVEIFLDPGFTQKEHLHFVVNALGTQQDNLSVRLDRVTAVGEAGLDWKAAASIGGDRWFAEVAIPWRLLDTVKPAEGEIWGFNLNREQHPKREVSHWNFVGGQFHQPDKFGLISFGTKPATLEMVRFGDLFKELTFALKANQATAMNLDVLLKIAESGTLIEEKAKRLSVGSDGASPLTFALPMAKPGSYDLTAQISHQGKTLYQLAFPFKTYSDGLVSAAWPPEMRNNKLHIAMNTVQHCFFLFANHFPDNRMVNGAQLEISVPDKVKILDPTEARLTGPTRYNPVTEWHCVEEQRDGKNWRKYTFKLGREISPSRIEKVRFFQNSLMLFFELEKGAFSAGEQLPVFFNLKANDIVEEENRLELVVLPDVRGIQPKEIMIYNWLWTFNENPHAWIPFMETMKQTGFNAISCSEGEPFYCLEAKKRKHKVINNLWWFWQNSEYLQQNPEHIAVTFKGAKAGGNNPTICPSIMLENNGKLIRQSIEKYTASADQKLTDGFVWDLEHPAVWDVCFCQRCIAEFRKFAAIPEQETLSPGEIRKKHAKQWILFATRQSSLTSGILRDQLRRKNPDILWGVYSGMPGQMTMESYRCDWEGLADYIDVAYPTGYSNSPAALNDRFVSGWKNFMELLNRSKSPDKKVLTVPTLTAGYERGQALQPSADLNRMQILRSVASGAHGASFWWWGPMDGLYYQEIGRATALIAEFEEFFLNGKNNNSLVKVEEHPYGLNVSWEVFSLDGKHLCILFNHSDKETRTLNLSFPELPQNLSGYLYPGKEKLTPQQHISVSIEPLETAVIVLQ